ncbi:hypothetical protein BC832DRAFT_559660 [Gaertneriomyces semiglobifer]|nr:hypothetical protein BC832DRAFT_559660 [Gaertneriomyces semiglobifer]
MAFLLSSTNAASVALSSSDSRTFCSSASTFSFMSLTSFSRRAFISSRLRSLASDALIFSLSAASSTLASAASEVALSL